MSDEAYVMLECILQKTEKVCLKVLFFEILYLEMKIGDSWNTYVHLIPRLKHGGLHEERTQSSSKMFNVSREAQNFTFELMKLIQEKGYFHELAYCQGKVENIINNEKAYYVMYQSRNPFGDRIKTICT